MAVVLSKSDFMLYLSHPAWLWLKKHDKSKLPAVDDNLQARFDAGLNLEGYAEQLFPGAIRLGFDGYDEFLTLASRTATAMQEGAKTLFQAKFDHENLTTICDIVEVLGEREVAITEIKASTSVKDKHRIDLAYQRYVLEQCGFKVSRCSVLLVNNKYIRSGEIDPQELFVQEEITEAVARELGFIAAEVEKALAVLESPTVPDLSPSHCGTLDKDSLSAWVDIYRTLKPIPEKSIYDLPAVTPQQIGEFEDSGILTIADIPEDTFLSKKQREAVDVLQSGEIRIDQGKIASFLRAVQYPVYFLDYEGCMDAIPPFEGTKPYQQIVIQWSLHVLPSPGGELEHYEYIHQSTESPFEAVSASLRERLGDTGSVIVWYKNYECGRNKELGELAPAYADFFRSVNDRVVDLMEIFSKKMYVHPEFLGSASIKKVLPAVVPDLSYKELNVQEGATASRLWTQAVLQNKFSAPEREKILSDLLTYCQLDTLAMVEIYRRMVEVAEITKDA